MATIASREENVAATEKDLDQRIQEMRNIARLFLQGASASGESTPLEERLEPIRSKIEQSFAILPSRQHYPTLADKFAELEALCNTADSRLAAFERVRGRQ